MSNIISYLKWRGDLTFEERPFNDVDNLVLSALAYIDLRGVVTDETDDLGGITVNDAASKHFEPSRTVDRYQKKRTDIVGDDLLKELANSKRFKDTRLFNLIDVYDEEHKVQFAALNIKLSEALSYIAYRGTDKSLIGWQEDFSMGYSEVPSQRIALEYLKMVLSHCDGKVIVGGHSKGGNLAMYAAMMSDHDTQTKIQTIYNNDGPGFSDDLNLNEQIEIIGSKTVHIVPEFSVIGMLFSKHVPHKIVKSTAKGIVQHDPMTWCIDGNCFEQVDEITPSARRVNSLIDVWIRRIRIDQRETFIKDLFYALHSNGNTLVDDIADKGIDGIEDILMTLSKSDKETKNVMSAFFVTAIETLKRVDMLKVMKNNMAIKGIVFAIIGIFFMQVPQNALNVIVLIIYVALFIYTGVKVTQNVIKLYHKQDIRKIRTVVQIIGFLIAVLFLIQNRALIISQSILLSILLFGNSIYYLKKYRQCTTKAERVWMFLCAICSLMFGLVTLITITKVSDTYIFFVGNFFVMTGFVEILKTVYFSSTPDFNKT